MAPDWPATWPAEQVTVFEVSRPNRQVRRAHGKSDVIDAIAAARAVISDQATADPEVPRRGRGRVAGTADRAPLRAQSTDPDPEPAARPDRDRTRTHPRPAPRPGRPQMLTICRGYRPGDRDDVASITKLALRELATRVADLDDQIKRVESRRHRLRPRQRPTSCWPCSASALTPPRPCWSPPGTTPTASTAKPLTPRCSAPARSAPPQGKTKRKRLNRGGDRQGNSALWHIVITRMATQPATKDYVERRTTEGLSTSEIIRCLKRYVAREVFNALPRELRT